MSDEQENVLRKPEQENILDEDRAVDIRQVSPDDNRLAKSKLAGEGVQDIETQAIKFVKQNSIVDGARDL